MWRKMNEYSDLERLFCNRELKWKSLRENLTGRSVYHFLKYHSTGVKEKQAFLFSRVKLCSCSFLPDKILYTKPAITWHGLFRIFVILVEPEIGYLRQKEVYWITFTWWKLCSFDFESLCSHMFLNIRLKSVFRWNGHVLSSTHDRFIKS